MKDILFILIIINVYKSDFKYLVLFERPESFIIIKGITSLHILVHTNSPNTSAYTHISAFLTVNHAEGYCTASDVKNSKKVPAS